MSIISGVVGVVKSTRGILLSKRWHIINLSKNCVIWMFVSKNNNNNNNNSWD